MSWSETERARSRRVFLDLDGEGLTAVLGALLQEWKLVVADCAAQADLKISGGTGSGGLQLDAGERGEVLALPVPMEGLYCAIERCLYRQPRQHLRVSLEMDLAVRARDEEVDTFLTSLSDRGARFAYHRELAPGEAVRLFLPLLAEPLELSGEVIYYLPREDHLQSAQGEVGLIFKGGDDGLRRQLRRLIGHQFLQRVKQRLPEALHWRVGEVLEVLPAE